MVQDRYAEGRFTPTLESGADDSLLFSAAARNSTWITIQWRRPYTAGGAFDNAINTVRRLCPIPVSRVLRS